MNVSELWQYFYRALFFGFMIVTNIVFVTYFRVFGVSAGILFFKELGISNLKKA